MIETRFHIPRQDFILDVSESFPASGVTAIFGPSGCGKTTWLRAIAGLERPDGGVCRFRGETWQDGSHFVPAHRRPIGYVFQDAALFPHLDVRGNLDYARKRATARPALPLPRMVERLGLSRLMDRHPSSLSGGEAQRVAIARALLGAPRLLLMDEPLAALDARARRSILELLEELRASLSIPIVYVSHSRDETARLADYLVLMDRGKVTATGALEELWTRLDIARGHGGAASTVIRATAAGHDTQWDLTRLDFAGGSFWVSRTGLQPGAQARLRIMARDVSITLERQRDTSILNIFPATVREMTQLSPAQLLVRLEVNGAPLLAGITRKSAAALGLVPGLRVYAQVKTVALL